MMEINAHMVTCALRLLDKWSIQRKIYVEKNKLGGEWCYGEKSHFWFKSLCVTGLSKLLTVIVSE